MKKFFLMILSAFIALSATAIPVKKGSWKTITLSDGTEVLARLAGDEWEHYWVGLDGKRYVTDEGTYQESTEDYHTKAMRKRMKAQQHRIQRLKRMKRAATTDAQKSNGSDALMARGYSSPTQETTSKSLTETYTGEKKGLIILVNFADVKFQTGHDQALYNNVANTAGYNKNGYKGSIADYFRDQSRGAFNLTFDVVGPVSVSRNMAYYGKDVGGEDYAPGTLVKEAVNQAKSSVSNWQQYDWDNDGEVDQVVIIYAGEGQASGRQQSNTIWPHEWDLQSAGTDKVLVSWNLYVNTYAVINEVDAITDESGSITDYVSTGIGTICHEFSHCLGLPDMYDTEYSGLYGMQNWSLMSSGNENGEGFVPAGYTSYERMKLGWLTAQDLKTATKVTNMRPLTDADDVYKVTNGGNENEYYLLENRQLNGWDSGLPAAGMLVLHIDYDEDIWKENIVNTVTDGSANGFTNDHQRCTIFHADGQDTYNYYYEEIMKMNALYDEKGFTNDDWETYMVLVNGMYSDAANDVYPQASNNQLTNTSTPRAFTYNANTDGRKLMNVSITDITQNSDGTISFNFAPDNSGSGTEGDNTNYNKPEATGIETITEKTVTREDDNRIYTLDGRFVGTDLNSLGHGIYIRNGKKIAK